MRRSGFWGIVRCGLTLLVAALSASAAIARIDRNVWRDGAIVRGDPDRRRIALVFTAADWYDGADTIISTLKETHVKASFFFTGKFFEKHSDIILRLLKDDHYVSGHGYAHLLYADWSKRDSTLISRNTFINDLEKNYSLMADIGLKRKRARYFIPPYEHYNGTVAHWANEIGLQMINFTPGSGSNADYTVQSMINYKSSVQIFQNVLNYETAHTLNGHFLLMHFGTHPDRVDKFYLLLPELIKILRQRGYKFVKVNDMIEK